MNTGKIHIIFLFAGLLFATTASAQKVEQMVHSKPFVLSGSLDATAIFYNANGIPDRYLPFNYIITGSPVVSIYGWQVPFSFIIGKQQNSFSQPFNQFGLSPSYKWITVHAGYRNLYFSPFTLGGDTFLGGAVELTPGKFRFAIMYGQFNRATALDTVQSLYFSNFSYKRTGMAVKIGYGTESNFIDLIAFKAKDDPGSVKISKPAIDSLGITPAENTVAGHNMKLNIWKQKISFESEGYSEVVCFYPDTLNRKGYVSLSVEITGLKLFDKSIFIDAFLFRNEPLQFTYRQNFLTIEFATLNFSNIRQIKYYYKLSGIDQNWVDGDVSGEAIFFSARFIPILLICIISKGISVEMAAR